MFRMQLVMDMKLPKKYRLYPDSRVELTSFAEKYYDMHLDIASFGLYKPFIKKVIKSMNIQPEDKIIDFGCGTGRNACLMAKYLNSNGVIIGLDISEMMHRQFEKKCKKFPYINFFKKRIDQPFILNEKFDRVFISFVIHGFPHEVRSIVIQNACNHLIPGGTFHILDFAEFDMDKMPVLHRYIFKRIECKYAFDFIKRDWKAILQEYGFGTFTEQFFFRKYVRLLTALKNG